MAENTKSDAPKGGAFNKASGSDTASAKISAGTSVGHVGESPMPHAQDQGGAEAGSASNQGAMASPASKPTSGNAGATGAGVHASSSQGAKGHQGRNSQGMSEQARQASEQIQQRASDALDQASDWARDTYERASSWASDAQESMSRRAGGRGQAMQRYMAQNPVMVGLAGLAAGLLIGALLPRTRKENETFGHLADEVREQGMRYAQDMTERGREYMDQAFNSGDEQFSRHESEFAHRDETGANRH